MSKIGIISDIHGNYPALIAVIDKMQKEKCDHIISLGDVAGYYSMINECLQLMVDNNIFSLKGNHDSYLLGESKCPRSKSVADCISYQQKILNPKYWDWFKSLKPIYKNEIFYAMHGGFENPIDEYINEFDFKLANDKFNKWKIFFSGHTHIQKLCLNDRIKYCNPGSVGQPRDYDKRAACAILDNDKISLHRVDYDIDMTAFYMKKAGFSEYYYKNLYLGCKIGEKRD